MSATTGKVALVTATTLLTCGTGCVPSATIRDFIGYGTGASSFEGSAPAPSPANATADLRLSGGAVDTDDNAADFVVGAPTPRSSGGAGDAAPTVLLADGSSNDVPVDGSISLVFSEPVDVTG